jgi:hypothetical protein
MWIADRGWETSPCVFRDTEEIPLFDIPSIFRNNR